MASPEMLKIIEDFKPTIRKTLDNISEEGVIIDVFDLRNDEVSFLIDYYGREYDVDLLAGFPAPGNKQVHNYVIIRSAYK